MSLFPRFSLMLIDWKVCIIGRLILFAFRLKKYSTNF